MITVTSIMYQFERDDECCNVNKKKSEALSSLFYFFSLPTNGINYEGANFKTRGANRPPRKLRLSTDDTDRWKQQRAHTICSRKHDFLILLIILLKSYVCGSFGYVGFT